MSVILRSLRAAPIVAALALSTVAAVAAAPAAVDLVFFAPHFAKVENGSTIAYRFVRTAADPKLDPSFEDEVTIKVGPQGAENSVQVDLFSGARAFTLPNMSKTGNPVIVALLEQDVKEMNKTLGGSPFYFRNRLRQAISSGAPAEPTKIDLGGKSVDGWTVRVAPFADDAKNGGKLGSYAGRTYEITFSDEVPGGLYSLKTVTPKQGGGALLTEELTYKAQGKSAAAEGAKPAEPEAAK